MDILFIMVLEVIVFFRRLDGSNPLPSLILLIIEPRMVIIFRASQKISKTSAFNEGERT